MVQRTLRDLAERFSISPEYLARLNELLTEVAHPESAGQMTTSIFAELADEGLVCPEPVSLWGLDEQIASTVANPPAIGQDKVPEPPQFGTDALARYQDLGLIGLGAMGEVRRVRDRDLNRVLAMKIAGREILADADSLARFLGEAQVIAQLQHPGIVPVHELGYLPDGRLYYTMKEVWGRTFSEVIAEVHAASRDDRWQPAASGWTFRRLVEVFSRVCEAVA